MDNTTNPTAVVKPKTRFHRYDVVTKKSTNTKHFVFRADGKLTRDADGGWSIGKGDVWAEYNANQKAQLDQDISTLGYIEL
jgi:hypothetical protein